jgi:hypothetical protein
MLAMIELLKVGVREPVLNSFGNARRYAQLHATGEII